MTAVSLVTLAGKLAAAHGKARKHYEPGRQLNASWGFLSQAWSG